jgi:hypothetical protein
MNPHLMRAAGFQSAFREREFAQVIQDADMRDGALAFAFFCRAAPATIAAIAHQPGFDSARLSLTANNRQISTFNGMRPKLLTEVSLGLRSPGKYHQTAGFFVQPMNRPYPKAMAGGGEGERG